MHSKSPGKQPPVFGPSRSAVNTILSPSGEKAGSNSHHLFRVSLLAPSAGSLTKISLV